MSCLVDGCDQEAFCRGLCRRHYSYSKRHIISWLPESNYGKAKEFYEKALEYDGNECLIWPFQRDKFGYGMMKNHRVHRRLCEEIHGPPPTPSHQAAHECNNGHQGCVAKNHLKWKTPKENSLDKQRSERWLRSLKQRSQRSKK